MRLSSATGLTARLSLGFLVALLMLALFGIVALRQTRMLRALQTGVIERNRLDSLQLLRIQSTLNGIALAARDMQQGTGGIPIPGYRARVDRLLLSLADALRRESELALASRNPEQGKMLRAAEEQLRASFLVAFRLAEEGRSAAALEHLAGPVFLQRSRMDSLVASMLVRNYETEEQSAEQAAAIHAEAERTLLLFVGGMALIVFGVGAFTVQHNRRVLGELERISTERGQLAREMIGMQENILRTVSRELHDDFGQILTAVNATLARVRRRLAGTLDASLTAQVEEVQQATRLALERARDLSQTLHPAVLDSHGLVGALERFLPGFERQSGIRVHISGKEHLPRIPPETAIHVYRVVQEALSNVTRHAQTGEAWIRALPERNALAVEVEDHGSGVVLTQKRKASGAVSGAPAKAGLGILAMKERAQILGGEFSLETPAEGGTRVRIRIPIATVLHETEPE